MNGVKLGFQDEFGVVVMCIWSIELILVSTYGKNGRKTHILEKNSRDCLGTRNAMFFYFDQCSYFGHNFLIYDPI